MRALALLLADPRYGAAATSGHEGGRLLLLPWLLHVAERQCAQTGDPTLPLDEDALGALTRDVPVSVRHLVRCLELAVAAGLADDLGDGRVLLAHGPGTSRRKPSDSRDRVRRRVQSHRDRLRAAHQGVTPVTPVTPHVTPPAEGGVTPVTPHVTPLANEGALQGVTSPEAGATQGVTQGVTDGVTGGAGANVARVKGVNSVVRDLEEKTVPPPRARHDGAAPPGSAYGSTRVHRALMASLLAAGVAADREVALPARSPDSRGETFRVDVMVRDAAGAPVCVIECKQYDGPPKGIRQRQNYARCGLPAYWCGPTTVQAVTELAARLAAGRDAPSAPQFRITDVASPDASWSARVFDLHREATGGEPTKASLRALKPLVERYGEGAFLERLAQFYASPAKRFGPRWFAEHYGDFDETPPAPGAPGPLSVDLTRILDGAYEQYERAGGTLV